MFSGLLIFSEGMISVMGIFLLVECSRSAEQEKASDLALVCSFEVTCEGCGEAEKPSM